MPSLKIILTFAVLALSGLATARAELKPGDVFPAISTVGPSGGEVPATEGKIIVVDFWASWCAPCKASFPALGKIYSEYNSRGVVLVGVSVDDRARDYTAFLKKQAPPFPTLHDAEHKLVGIVKVEHMPTTYLIGRDGKVRFVQSGYFPGETDKVLRTELDRLLAEKN